MGSIRWRLPLSYAGIALLAVLVLGSVLLLALSRFYQDQERRYLTNNAFVISNEIEALLAEDGIPVEAVTAQLRGFAFLSQTRIRVLDEDNSVIADSGTPAGDGQSISVTVDFESEIEIEGQSFSQETTTQTSDGQTYQSRIVVRDGLFFQNVEETIVLNDGLDTIVETAPLGVSSTPYGFGLNSANVGDGERSDMTVVLPIFDPFGGRLGALELSQGPAYGTAVLRSVAWGWGLAGVVAMLLAAFVGWRVSRRLTAPLLALTAVTEQMSGGNLSARANVAGNDELGLLATSFNQMAEQVEETVQTLRRFVADAAHEINTPLTALKTNVELANREENGRSQFHLHQAQQQIDRLESLTAGLLDLSVVESRQTSDTWLNFDVRLPLRRSGELFASQAEQKGLAFRLSLPAEPLTVWGQISPLRQAVEALLDNAIKFSEVGEISLVANQLENQIEIQVSDSGMGIEAGEAAKIFDRFFRGKKTAALPGSGLGLVIAKAIVEQHGGNLTLMQHSQLQGCTFCIQLPNA